MSNQKGLSLIEVLAAIILLSVIFISMYGFFINSFKFNAINDENVKAMNIAREYKALLNQGTIDYRSSAEPGNTLFNIQKFEKDGYTIKISVNRTPETGNFYRKVFLAHIEVYKDPNLVSETYTYIEGDVMLP